MASTVAEVMTRELVTIEADAPVVEAARRMRQSNVGDVIVLDTGKMCGIVTDRDLVVRALALEKNPATPVREVCSGEVAKVTPDMKIDQAVQLMRAKAIRRLPVVEGDRPVGVLSLGDLAMERDERSALADISAAPANT